MVSLFAETEEAPTNAVATIAATTRRVSILIERIATLLSGEMTS